MLNILITGARGQLGSSLRQLGSVSPNNYLATDVAELDITDAGAVLQTVKEQRIDVIVNCAALWLSRSALASSSSARSTFV